MKSREDVVSALSHCSIHDDTEAGFLKRTIQFIQATPKAFERDHEAGGHVGASAVVVDASRQFILFAQHTITGAWSFFGNHCDGRTDLADVARARIAKDASMAVAVNAATDGAVFDVDIHDVPPHERRGEAVPAHLHYDIAFLFAADRALSCGEARWFSLEEAQTMGGDGQFARILFKLSRSA